MKIKILLSLGFIMITALFFASYKIERSNHITYVTLDKKKIIELYRHDIEKSAKNSDTDVDGLKKTLEKKNKQFLYALVQELDEYQKNHNAVILNIESVLMPGSFQAKQVDITINIAGKLKKRGLLS